MSTRKTVVFTTLERSTPAAVRMAREILDHPGRLSGDAAVHQLAGGRVEARPVPR